MARFELLFPTKWLGSADLGGKDVDVKISKIRLEGIDGQDEKGGAAVKQKAVVTLEGVAKEWLLNRTCAEAIVTMYGPETTDWKGKPLTLHAVMVESFGAQVLAVRVKGSPLLKEPVSRTVKRGRKKIVVNLVPTGTAPKETK